MTIQTIDRATYYKERAAVDVAERYRKRVAAGRNYLTGEEAAAPEYRAVNNAMRGRVEQFEILHNPPERLVAYIGDGKRNGCGIDRILGQSFPVTTWAGDPIGFATKGATWRVSSYVGTHMSQFYARIAGREYTGRGFGEGMAILLKETAESKRSRGAI